MVQGLIDCDGISVYKINNNITPLRVVAAYKAKSMYGAGPVEYTIISEKNLMFIYDDNAPGTTIDDEVNLNHRNYKMLTREDYTSFADVVYDTGTTDKFDKTEINDEIIKRKYKCVEFVACLYVFLPYILNR